MPTVSTYLNFVNQTESAFLFYKKVFGTEFIGPIMRYGEIPGEGEKLPAEQKNLVMHIELPILGGHVLMGTDVSDGMGSRPLQSGNQVHINLQPDTKEEADHLFSALSDGGEITMPMEEMFWGGYFGSLMDSFGIYWMIHVDTRND